MSLTFKFILLREIDLMSESMYLSNDSRDNTSVNFTNPIILSTPWERLNSITLFATYVF